MTWGEGELIGERYRLEELIGSGGMGEVFRARDTLLERAVALKLVDVVDPRRREEVTRNFLREARISAAIAHRNVVQILDFGMHAGTVPFIVMELLEGETLAQVLGRGERPSFGWIVELVQQVLDGLAAAHAAGVVHRDLKPENIYLVRSPSGVYPKILDFGISKLMDDRGAAQITTTRGVVVGTPAYMSPEQARGVKFIDKRTDLYTMGVVLYELLSGEMPFFSENPGDLMVMIVTTPATPLALHVPIISKALADVVARAMHKSPDKRFADARQMQEALRLASEQLQAGDGAPALDERARPASWRKRALNNAETESAHPSVAPASLPVRRARGPRQLATILSVTLAGIALGATVVLFSRSSAAPAPRFIVVQADRPPAQAGSASELREERRAPGAAPIAARANRAVDGSPSAVDDDELAAPASDASARIAPHLAADRRAESSPALQLADSFRKQKKGVVACVNQHAAEAERNSKLAVRIALDPSGRVANAQALPASIASATMGQCIERAVRAMHFPSQRSALSFEVPLTARKEE